MQMQKTKYNVKYHHYHMYFRSHYSAILLRKALHNLIKYKALLKMKPVAHNFCGL